VPLRATLSNLKTPTSRAAIVDTAVSRNTARQAHTANNLSTVNSPCTISNSRSRVVTTVARHPSKRVTVEDAVPVSWRLAHAAAVWTCSSRQTSRGKRERGGLVK
jgi:hypothetical protein